MDAETLRIGTDAEQYFEMRMNGRQIDAVNAWNEDKTHVACE